MKNILKKKNGKFYYKWKFDTELEFWYLDKFTNKTNTLIETKIITMKDKDGWNQFLINQGFLEQ